MALCLAGEEHGDTSDKLTGSWFGTMALFPFYFVPSASTSVYSHFSYSYNTPPPLARHYNKQWQLWEQDTVVEMDSTPLTLHQPWPYSITDMKWLLTPAHRYIHIQDIHKQKASALYSKGFFCQTIPFDGMQQKMNDDEADQRSKSLYFSSSRESWLILPSSKMWNYQETWKAACFSTLVSDVFWHFMILWSIVWLPFMPLMIKIRTYNGKIGVFSTVNIKPHNRIHEGGSRGDYGM